MRDLKRLILSAAVLCAVAAAGAGLLLGGNAAAGSLCGGSFGPCPPVKAKLKTPASVLRGDTLRLDASKSTGPIDSYRFHFQLGPGCPSGVKLAHDSKDNGGDPVAEVKLLCSLKVTVTVSGNGESDTSSSVIAAVKPRKFDPIPFHQSVTDYATLPFTGQIVFGGNRSLDVWVSSDKNYDAPDRWLDPGPDPTGTNGAVDIEQLNDPGGPFDGMFWVTGDHLTVDRVIIINSQLVAGGAVFEENTKGHYPKSLADVVAATRDHERIHGELVQQALSSGQVDPLKDLEKAISSDQADLLDQTNSIIRDAEGQLKAASSEDKVHAAMSQIWGGETATIRVEGASGTYAPKTYVLSAVGD